MVKVKIGLNQQQMKFIQHLKQQGNYGNNPADIIRSVFRQWMKEEGFIDS